MSLSKFCDLDSLERGTGAVLCHGCFDLLHLGHVRHLQEARQYGAYLIVTVTPDEFVRKGPGRPAFKQAERAEMVAALGCVGYVAVNRWPTAVETIKLLRPRYYAKGPECAYHKTPMMLAEEEAAAAVGCEVIFTTGKVWSSTRLLESVGGCRG